MKPHIRRNAFENKEQLAFNPQDFTNVAENQEDDEEEHYDLFDDVHNYGPI